MTIHRYIPDVATKFTHRDHPYGLIAWVRLGNSAWNGDLDLNTEISNMVWSRRADAQAVVGRNGQRYCVARPDDIVIAGRLELGSMEQEFMRRRALAHVGRPVLETLAGKMAFLPIYFPRSKVLA